MADTIPKLFVILCRYAPEPELAPHYEGHVKWANHYSQQGVLLLAGPTPTFESGVILAAALDEAALNDVLHQDSFAKAGLVDYEVTEFSPRRGALRYAPENPLYFDEAARTRAFAPGAVRPLKEGDPISAGAPVVAQE